MLLRKRAWDIMREDFARVQENASLAEVIKTLNLARNNSADNNFVVVYTASGAVKGLISIWNIIQALGPCLLEQVSYPQKDQVNWDQAFCQACKVCSQTQLDKFIQKDIPKVRPSDPLARVLEILLDYRRGRVLVEEGNKVLGIILLSDIYGEIGKNVE